MELSELKRDLRKFIVGNYLFGDDQYAFSDEESFLESGIIDSTGILELIEYVVKEYAISISDEEILPENLDSIQNLSSFIVSKSADVVDTTA